MEVLTSEVQALLLQTQDELHASGVHMGLMLPVKHGALVVAVWEKAADILAFLDMSDVHIAGLLLLGEPIGTHERLPSLQLYEVLAQGQWESAWQRQVPSACVLDVVHHADVWAVATAWQCPFRSVQELFVKVAHKPAVPRHVWPMRFMHAHGLCLLSFIVAMRDRREGAAKMFSPAVLKDHMQQDMPVSVAHLLWTELDKYRAVMALYMHVIYGTGSLLSHARDSPVVIARLNDAHPDLQDRAFHRQAVLDVFTACRSAVTVKSCTACLQPNVSMRCAGCRQVLYCDTACQRLHWVVHRATCNI
jgi:hypothetical protein